MSRNLLIFITVGIILLCVFLYFAFGLNGRPNENVASESVTTDQKPSFELKMEDTVEGTGPEVKSGDTIVIHYNGTLTDGTKFDSSYDRGKPFETQIGVGQVIKGWDEGVIGMKVGGKRKLTIPSDMGYGEQGTQGIPPNATLIFDVELVEIK